jgi:hypothetical protein
MAARAALRLQRERLLPHWAEGTRPLVHPCANACGEQDPLIHKAAKSTFLGLSTCD